MRGLGAVQQGDAVAVKAADAAADDSTLDEVEQVVERHPWIETVTRFGWGAEGLVYAVMGVLAVAIARSDEPEEDASPEGALSVVLERPLGQPLLGLVGVGLVLYVAWRLLSVVLQRGTYSRAWLHRVGYAFGGTFVAILAWTAVRNAMADDDPDRSTTIERISAELVGSGLGSVAILIGGAITIGLGLYFAHRALTCDLRDELDMSRAAPLEARAVDPFRVVGHVDRSLVTIFVGIFVGVASLRADPSEARDFDSSLRHVAAHPGGAALVLTAAVGLVLCGVFCLVSFCQHKLVDTTSGGDR